MSLTGCAMLLQDFLPTFAILTLFAIQIPHQCTAISLFIPFVDTYDYVYVCNVHTITVVSFIRSSKFVYIVYLIT